MDRDPIIAGQVVTFGAPFLNDDGQPEDPSTVIFLLNINNALYPNQYVYGVDARVVRDGVGLYHIDIDTTGMAGVLTGEWVSDGAGKTIGYKVLNIRTPAIPSPYPASIDPATSSPPNAFLLNPSSNPAPDGYVLTQDSSSPLTYQWLPVTASGSLLLTGGTMSGPINMGAEKITNLENGSSAQDAVTFEQLAAETARAEAAENGIIASISVREVVPWATNTSYAMGQFVSNNNGFYQAPSGGVPSRSVFTAGDWIHVADINVPVGTTSSTVAAGNAPAAAQAAAEAASDPVGTAAGLVATETSRAEGVEATKASTSALSSEASTRASADTTLTNNLAAEVTRAETAEGLLAHSTTVAAEVTRAEAAEGVLTTNLAAEVTRAETAEGTKASTSALNSEISRAEAAEALKASTTSLTSEVNRAESAETALGTRITNETNRAETAEGGALQKSSNLSDIGTPSTARTNLGLGSAATQNTSAFDAAGTAVTHVATETTRAETAEALALPKAGGTMTGPIVLSGNPTANLQAAAKQYVDAETTRAEAAEATLTTNLGTETTRAETAEALAVPKAGATMTGPLILSEDPVTGLQAATGEYVDAETARAIAAEEAVQTNLNNEVTRAEGIESGLTSGLASEVTRAEGVEATLVPVAGGTMTGPLVLPSNPTAALQAAPKQYVDAETTRAEAVEAGLVNVAGDTMTGELLLPGNPADALGAVPKQYVDGLAQGLTIKNPVEALADSNLVSLSGLSTIDGYSTNPGDRVLLTGQANTINNGLWLIATGAWTRPTDFATGSSEASAYVLVNDGNTYAGTGFLLSGDVTVDTDPETWLQFSAATEVTAGTGITKTGNVISNAGVVTFNGRSGAVVPTTGDYTAAQVGADVSGAGTTAAAAEATRATAAEGVLTAAVSTETSRAETAEALVTLIVDTIVTGSSAAITAQHYTPVDTTSAACTLTLPTAPANGTLCGAKMVIQGSTHTVTVTCGGSDVIDKASGPTTYVLSAVNQGVTLQYASATHIWMAVSDDLPLASADLRYLQLSGGALTGAVTTSSTISAITNLISARNTSGGTNISLDGTTFSPSIAIAGGGRFWLGSGTPAATITTGSAAVGDLYYSIAGQVLYSCITAGSPGTWSIQQNTLVSSVSAPGATPTINVNADNYFNFTAMAAAITGITVTGTPAEGDILTICFTDNGTARAITHGTSFEASTVALATTTVISTKLTEVFFWNAATSKYRLAYKF